MVQESPAWTDSAPRRDRGPLRLGCRLRDAGVFLTPDVEQGLPRPVGLVIGRRFALDCSRFT